MRFQWLSRLICRPIRPAPRTPNIKQQRKGNKRNAEQMEAVTHPSPTHATVPEQTDAPAFQRPTLEIHPSASPQNTLDAFQLNPSLREPSPSSYNSTDHTEDRPLLLHPGLRTYSFHTKLRHARIKCSSKNKHKFFVPRCQIERLTRPDEVIGALYKAYPNTPPSELNPLAETISKNAPLLFATLGFIRHEHDIVTLLREDVTDKDFPFELSQPTGHQYKLQGKGGRKINSISQWTDEECEDFHKCQWWMNAPTFGEAVHHEFEDDVMLPFIKRTSTISIGGFSKVYLAEIHPSHHNFRGVEPSREEGCHVAIKEITTSNADDAAKEFKKETEFFQTLALQQRCNHPHLIELLATYRWRNKYHLVFPCANENLDKYWEKTNPTFDEPTMRWCLDQMSGLVNGLLNIHECSVINAPKPSKGTHGSNSSIMVKEGEEKFGRHGDLKPENILWFADANNPRGILKIADFGLGRFHGRDTRSGIDYNNIKSSPTYEPPELRLKVLVSRAYDMWSLGCIFLEFASWILKGSKSNREFSEARGQQDPDYREMSNDLFFTLVDKTNGVAEVHQAVVGWVTNLHSQRNCSPFMHDLLDLIMDHLLVISPFERIRATDLDATFSAFIEKAKDPGYLVEPVPGPMTVEPTIPAYQTPRPPSSQAMHIETLENVSPAQLWITWKDRSTMEAHEFRRGRFGSGQSDPSPRRASPEEYRRTSRSVTWPTRPIEEIPFR